MLEILDTTRKRFRLEVFAWVYMPEHIHLLVRPPEDGDTLDRILLALKLSLSRRVIHRWQELDAPILRRITDGHGSARFWQRGGGFDRNVRSDGEFCRTVRYIHRNPVERGLVPRPEDWRWSSVRWWMGQRAGEFGCDAPPGRPESWNGWEGYR